MRKLACSCRSCSACIDREFGLIIAANYLWPEIDTLRRMWELGKR